MFFKSKISQLISHPHKNPIQFQFLRTFIDNVDIKFVRDKGLDRVVEREKDLKPLINLKNFLKLNPSNSIPLSSIVDNNKTLKIPYQALELIRKYPSFFGEFDPGNIGIDPHIRLTRKSLDLDDEEQLIFDSDKKNAADRLLKLLMLCRVNKIPLYLIDKLKWELGLPDNYVDCLIPEFPDYFRVNKGEGFVELVSWNDELAVSGLEKMSKKTGNECIAFPMKYSKGFEVDERLKEWIDEWQKLPYISPYENAAYLQPNSDESDKWTVAVLHELLHILMGKKSERENVLCLGGYMGVKTRIKRAMAHHPEIFYLSRKNETYTLVLREGYDGSVLIDKHPLMDLRRKYIQLMYPVKEVQKSENEGGSDVSKQKMESGCDENEGEGDVTGVDDEKEDEEKARGKERRDENKSGRSMVNEDDRGRGVRNKSGKRGFDKVNEEERGRGGNKSNGKGSTVNVEGGRHERRGHDSGRRVNGKGEEERNARNGGRDGRRVTGKGDEERNARNGGRGGRREPGKENDGVRNSRRTSDSRKFI